MSHDHDHGHSHEHACGPGCGCDQEGGGDKFGVDDYRAGVGDSSKPFGGVDGMVPLITRYGVSWGDGVGFGNPGGNVTYSFLAPTGGNTISMSAEGRATIAEAMRIISEVANITFTWADAGRGAGFNSANGDIDITARMPANPNAVYGSGGWAVDGTGVRNEITSGSMDLAGVNLGLYLHEVMHAIGLAHPGEYNGNNGTYASSAPFWDDSEQFTLMSYWDASRTGANYSSFNADTLGLYDIAALQAVYGVNTTTRAGNTVYGFTTPDVQGDAIWRLDDANDDIIGSLWDAGGTDTIDLSGFASASTIDLREGAFSSFGGLVNNFSIAYGAKIENATGGSGNDTIIGNALANTIIAGAGTDRAHINAGDVVFGGAGSDTGVIDGFARGTTGGVGWDGRFTVDQMRDAYTLSSIENLELRDGSLLTGNAAKVQRLYDTVFNRDADAGGLATWTSVLDTGSNVAQIATQFVVSAEFQATYGSLDNTGFVTLLYRNVLDRAPDQAGLDNWRGMLDDGSSTRASVVTGFSESAEHVQQMSSDLARDATWLGDKDAESVARLYYAAFQRAPDERGLGGWLAQVDTGVQTAVVAQSFAASAEFQATYGALDNGSFVDLMYMNVLDRTAETQGRTNWTGQLDSGALTRGAVLDGFAQSAEFQLRTDPLFDDGITFV